MTSLPPISTLPTLPAPSITSILDTLFEPSPPLHALSLPTLQSTTYPSYTALIAAIHTQLSTLASSSSLSDIETLSAILCAHPRLGEKKVDSEQSRKEQAQLNKGGMEEAEELGRLNGVYEEQFPGLRYVVFVNGRSRPVVMENMKARIARGDIGEERREAIQAMCDIATDRAKKLTNE